MATTLAEIVDFLDDWLQIDSVEDASLNGLQVQACDQVRTVALAVDAAAATIEQASARECDLLFVHHGLLYGPARPLRGTLGQSVRACFGAGLSVYAAHLPLDKHPEAGNNVLLLQAIGARRERPFGMYHGVDLGLIGCFDPPRKLAEVAGALAAAGVDDQILWAFGADPVQRVGVVTGSGCGLLEQAVDAGVDCFITGEPRHSAYHLARECAISCLFGGHYATETFGVRAVGERLQERFGVQTQWIDHPTGV